MRLLVDLILEEHFIEIKTESDRPHDYSVKLMTGLPKKKPPPTFSRRNVGQTPPTDLEESEHCLLAFRGITFLRP